MRWLRNAIAAITISQNLSAVCHAPSRISQEFSLPVDFSPLKENQTRKPVRASRKMYWRMTLTRAGTLMF
jgi:hypothetical protein